jgi:hypothetical protein
VLGRCEYEKKEQDMRKRLTALIVSLLLGGAAHAGVHVVITGTGTCTTSSSSPGSSPFTLTASTGCDVLVNIYGDSNSDDIGRITLTGDGTVRLYVGNSGSFPTTQTTQFASWVARDWDGLALSSFSGTVRVAAAINQDITSSVTASQVFRIEANRDIKAAITATAVDPSSAYAMGPVWAGRSITSTGSVVASATPGGGQTTQIRDVRAGTVTSSGSTLAGPITVLYGSIGEVIAAGSIAISSGGIQARDGIDYIEAASIDADIRANANGGSGDLGGVTVYTGDLEGSIRSRNLATGDASELGVHCDSGDILASLEFDGDVSAPIFAAIGFGDEASIVIHGSLTSSITASVGNTFSVEIDGD